MLNTALLFVALASTWLVLSGFFKPFFFGLGAISCTLAVLIAYKIRKQQGNITGVWRTVFFLPKYLGWLEWQVIKSSLDVAVKMWQIEPDISPCMAWVPSKQRKEIGMALYANSITMTPGTVSVMVRPNQIQVHALTQEALAEVQSGQMDSKALHVVGEDG